MYHVPDETMTQLLILLENGIFPSTTYVQLKRFENLLKSLKVEDPSSDQEKT